MTIFQRALAFLLLAVFMGVSWAAPADAPHATVSPTTPNVQTITPAGIKNELLDALRADGLLNNDQRTAAATKYITPVDSVRFDVYSENTSWTRHLTWSLALKCLGLLMLFAAMWGWIKAFAKHFNGWLRKIPLVVYQTVMLTLSLAGFLIPERIYPAHAFDLALFCAFTTPLIAVWLVASNARLAALLAPLFFNGTVARYLVPALGATYFLTAALALESQILGMAAMWFMLSIPYLVVASLTKKAFGSSDESYMVSALASHLLGVGLWMALAPGHSNAVITVLSVAANYYLPVAICLMLFVAMAPIYWYSHKNTLVFYVAFYILLVSASFSGIFAVLPAMNGLLALAGIATVLFWVVERSFKVGYLFGTFVTGVTLYVLSLNIDAIRVWLSSVHFVA